MGYWIVKRRIKEIACIVTLRSEQGDLLARSSFAITQPNPLRFELADFLSDAGIDHKAAFSGSMEIEFFASVNLVFPYPAVVINYYGKNFSSVVHTTQRIYNDFEDRQRNSQSTVPEAGFNIYADQDVEPFISLINGPEKTEDCTIQLEFYNTENQVLRQDVTLGTLLPYQTTILYPARQINLAGFLHGSAGTAKVKFGVNWIFPRLVVGNVHRSLSAMSITHTYYDCTKETDENSYWKYKNPAWYQASLMVPAEVANGRFTNINFYPIYSPSVFVIHLEIYDADGKCLLTQKNILKIDPSQQGLQTIPLKLLLEEAGIAAEQDLGARLIAEALDDHRLPARIKLGLDIGYKETRTPCNICTNLHPYNPSLETKPKSFRWGPVLADQPGASIWIMNSGPAIDYKKEAVVDLEFYREIGNETLKRNFTLPPHGFKVIRIDEDPELQSFFKETVGWYTASISAPYSTTYYFSENQSGVVGGDHGF
jgi:hypothetical protein